MRRVPDGVMLIALYHFLIGALTLLGACALFTVPILFTVPTWSDPSASRIVPLLAFFLFLGVGFLLALAIANIVIGWGLLRLAEWARIGAMILSLLRLLNFPIGTIIGALILWYLLQPQTAAAFHTR